MALATARADASRRWWQPQLWAGALNWVLAVLAAALPVSRLLEAHRDNQWWRYQAAEWLINFAGGPVRRGLSGQILISVPGVSSRTTVTVLVVALAVLVPLLFALLVGTALRRSQHAWPILLWGVPGGVLLGLRQGQWIDLPESVLLFATRKEQLFLALLLGFSLLLIRSRWSLNSLALGYGLVMVPMAFVHEGLTFVFAVAGAWLAMTAAAAGGLAFWHTNQLLVGARVLVPAAVGVVVTIPFASPDRDHLERMWQAVDPETRLWLGDTLPGPFELMGYSFGEALDYAGTVVLNPRGIALWSLLAGFVWLWTLFALWLTDTSRLGVRFSLATLGVMILAVLPLLPVAIDWGRFIVIAALTTAIIVLTRQQLAGSSVRPAPWNWLSVIAALALLSSLAFLGIPEAGAPFGE